VLYGVSCFRQVHVSSVHTHSEAYTRARVQKAVCALINVPLLGSILTRLRLVTHAYFEQGNFEDREMLALVHTQLNVPLSKRIEEASFYIGFNVGQFVSLFKRDFLALFKLMLIEKKVILNGTSPVSDICNCLLSLLSLLPGELTDAKSEFYRPALPTTSQKSKEEESSASLSTQERRARFGLPLHIFDFEDQVVPVCADELKPESSNPADVEQPTNRNPLYLYTCLQQIESLRKHPAYFAATSNPFFNNIGCVDVIVHINQGKVDLKNKSLSRALSLTTSDKRFIDNIIQRVDQFTKEGSTHWEGSDDWIRAQFASYLESFFTSLLTVDQLFSEQQGATLILSPVVDFNPAWVKAWLVTANCRRWKQQVQQQAVNGLASPVHPAGASPDILDEISQGVNGLSKKFASKMSDMELREKFESAKAGFWSKLKNEMGPKGKST